MERSCKIKKFGDLVRIERRNKIVAIWKYISMLRDSFHYDLLIYAFYTTSTACCVTWRRCSQNPQAALLARIQLDEII
jgi:hypothetical protein